jgi:phenylacetate-CoA ligase
MSSSREQRLRLATLDRKSLAQWQLERLNRLLARVSACNAFYNRKLAGRLTKLESLDQLAQLPFTTKDELLPRGGKHGPPNLTFDQHQYSRFHQTSGTRGRPMPVFDTPEDWQSWIDIWQFVLDAADITDKDRALLAFSFGPFIGFWSAFDALIERGAMVIPSGGLSSQARLDLAERTGATALFCTPTYALRLAEVAAQQQFPLHRLGIRVIVVAGEPGGSIPAVRQAIEQAWHARVIDHAGASEVGPWGFGDAQGTGLHVVESDFIAEFLSVETGEPASRGELSQLVLTSLSRPGCPVIRYRTGDLVRPTWPSDGPCRFVQLEGGVLGRADDMLVIRGVNIFPSSVEQILRSFPEVVEYRMTARKRNSMDELLIEVEDRLDDPVRLSRELQKQLGLKIAVSVLPPATLPRFEGKGRRFIDER